MFDLITCPDHPGMEIEDFRAGDLVCTMCGLVLGERLFEPMVRDESKFSFYDNFPIVKEARSDIKEINNLADRLYLSSQTINKAYQFYEDVMKNTFFKSKSLELRAAVSIFAACRADNCPRSFSEVCAVTCNVTKKELGRCFKIFSKDLDLNNSKDISIERFCRNLDLSYADVKRSQVILEKLKIIKFLENRSPNTLIALAIFIASKSKSMQEIGQVLGVSESTLLICNKHIEKLQLSF